MTDISVSSVAYQVEKRSWLLSQHGTDPGTTPSITLDVSAFTPATHYPNGYLLSGIVLGRITAGGKFGPYSGRASEVQTVGLGAATAGTVTVTFDGETTAAIAFNATAATVQAALEALSNLNSGDVTVTGGPLPGVMTLTFAGARAGANVPEVTVTPTGLTGGTVTVATTTQGGTAVADGRQTAAGLLFSSVLVPNLADLTKAVGSARLVHGFVDPVKLPIANGATGGGFLDAAARADLKLIHFAS